jgi:hypothetical protein
MSLLFSSEDSPLDGDTARAYLPIAVEDTAFETDLSTLNEKPMGSIRFGIADPMATIGPALPQDIEINRAGPGRVRSDGRG